MKNRETGDTQIIRREVEAPLTVSTAPLTRNQALTLSTSVGVLGLGLVGFGSRRGGKKKEMSWLDGDPTAGAFGTGIFRRGRNRGEIAESSDLAERLRDAKRREDAELERTEYKQISAWITEREREPQKPLRLKESYTLNFKVGGAVTASLLHGPEARVPETDIPKEGLDTEWIVVSRSVRLWKPPSAASTLSVTSKVIDNRSAWTARFPLHIPKQGESAVVQLGISPLNTEQTGLDIYIHVDGELYRQLAVKFIVQEEDETRPVLAGTDGESSHAGT